MNDLLKDAIYKEDEVFHKLYQTLQSFKDNEFIIKHAPQIGPYKPDFVVLGKNGYLAVIEVKYSLNYSVLCSKACGMVKQYMELTGAPWGYVTDGRKTLFLKLKTEEIEEIEDFYVHFERLLEGYSPIKETEISEDQLDNLKKQFDEVYQNVQLPDREDFTKHLKSTDFVQTDGLISFTEDKEREFMEWILGSYQKESLCRYTSMAGLFRTLDSKKHSMVCLVGMNDKGETNYIQNYMRDKAYPKHYSISNSKLNDLFILSCCDELKENDLTMFRLYGDDSRGVCLKYGIKKPEDYKEFFIAPVSYANADGSHPKLDLFLGVCQFIQIRHFDAWLHFFKSFDYQVENEVRVLYERNHRKKKWVNISSYGIICPVIEFEDKDFPLMLDKIILGPNCPEKDVNNNQIETMLQEEGIVIKYGVDVSRKDSYRVSN